ncbi:hypothetical protein ONZ45_g4363 [Pleurotus djamor]|nr:hypothetical protein ONZ45_g4363 [Pleurotus djamor]
MTSGPPPAEAGPSKTYNAPEIAQSAPVASYHPHLAATWPATSTTTPYASASSNPYSHYYTWTQPVAPPSQPAPKPPTPEPSPPPDDLHRHWDSVIRTFLDKMGLKNALRGFELDMLVLNSDWERNSAPKIVDELVSDLTRLKSVETSDEADFLTQRKVDYISTSHSQLQNTSIKEISKLLARNRAKNAQSNVNEFLHLNSDASGCARTNAKHQDRDLQMKYDIAKNEDGPLRRTMQAQVQSAEPPNANATTSKSEAQQRPGLDDRLRNIETHLAIRYVPSTPKDFLSRLKFLEDHIIRLEKDYPPWAALHFNQPNRGWPPPPRTNPIIVPTHLREVKPSPASDTPSTAHPRGEKSSLHQAVMERLQVQQAMGELGATSSSG